MNKAVLVHFASTDFLAGKCSRQNFSSWWFCVTRHDERYKRLLEEQSSTLALKEFKHSAELLPLTTPGVSSLNKFQERERDLCRIEELKHCGLSQEEIQLYQDEEEGMARNKMENSVLREKLKDIYSKLESARDRELNGAVDDSTDDSNPSTSNIDRLSEFERKPTFYPEHHPMNSIKDIAKDLFDHIKTDEITPITKRRKVLRRLHRKQEAVNRPSIGLKDAPIASASNNPNSMWDVKEIPRRLAQDQHVQEINRQNDDQSRKRVYGPKPQSLYTIKDQRIVRLEPIAGNSVEQGEEQYKAVDIVVPVNRAEKRLLEGTKLTLDQIRSMERFKHYNQGSPSKVLFLKNISPSVSSEDIAMLFKQFVKDNGAPVNIRLMTGRLRGQAFVHFQHENVAIQALEKVNGIVVKGRPVIVQFGKSSNNLQQND